MGRYTEAYDVLQQALEIRAGQSDSISMAVTHNNLGDVFFDQHDYPKALAHYHASVRLITGQGSGQGITELPVASQIEHHPRVLDAFRYIGFKADAWRQYCKDSGEVSYCARTYGAQYTGTSADGKEG
jgi:tetratricopeptide (TPR) repeat protein